MMGPIGTMTPSGDLTFNITHEGRLWVIRLHKLAMFLMTGKQYKSVSFADGVKTNLVFDNLVAVGVAVTEESIGKEGTQELRNAAKAVYEEQKQVRNDIRADWLVEREKERVALLEERLARKESKKLAKEPAQDPYMVEYLKKFPKGGPTQSDYDQWDKEDKERRAEWYATPERQAIVARANELQKVFNATKHRQGLRAGVDWFSFNKFMEDSEKHSRFKTVEDVPAEFMKEFDYEACGIEKWEYDRIAGLKVLKITGSSQFAAQILLNYMVDKPAIVDSWQYVTECPEAGRMLSELRNQCEQYMKDKYDLADPNGANAPTSEPSVEPQTNPAQPTADQQ